MKAETRKTKEAPRLKSVAKEIVYIALSIAIITVCAWITIPTGTIPVTLQTFAVALIASLLGPVRSLIAVAVYLVMGLIGIPVFSSFNAGAAALLGPTGGYIIGFLFDVVVAGLFARINVKNKIAKTAIVFAGMIAGLALCYFFGTLWFITVYNRGASEAVGVGAALMLCVVPYLLPDAVKLLIAAVLGVRLKPYLKLDKQKKEKQKNPQ